MKMKRLTILILAATLLMVGCSEDEPFVPPIVDGLTLPTSPDQLMTLFFKAYETKDVDLYASLLGQEFGLHLQQETKDQFPDVGPTIDHDKDLRIAERMFSGDDLRDPLGNFVPDIIGISFRKFEQLEDWTESGDTDPIPGKMFATYVVDILFDRGQDQTQVSVKGLIRFYVDSLELILVGEMRRYYYLVGQVDLTIVGKASEEDTWGGMKCLYR
jgi:hypothetical protein